MVSDWKSHKIGELADSISVTHPFDKKRLIFLNTSDILIGKVLHNSYKDIGSLPGQAKKTIKKDDVLLSEIRPANGRYAFIDFEADDYVVSTKLMVIRAKEKILPKFLFYFLTNKSITSWLQHLAESRSGTFPQITFDQIADLNIKLPDRDEQQKIVAYIGAIDEKSELNHQMNKTLEKIGQLLFKHWFIDFEFPNKKGKPYKSSGGEMVDSELGEIPKGWDVRPFSEVIAVSPRRQLTKGSVAKKVSMADLERWQSWITSWSREEYRGGSVFKNSDTLFARITPCLEQGKTAFVSFLDHEEVAFGSTEFIVLSPKFIKSPAFIFFLSRSTKFRDEAIMSMTGTSGRQRVPNEVFDKYLIACPPDRLMDTFDKLVGPMMVMINNNALELTSLGAIRDSLLPRLMSGQIRVPGG